MPNICGRSAARLRWGRARLPNPASATVDAEWAKRARRVRLFLARIAIAIRGTSSNHDEGCPLNLTPCLRFYDSGMTQPGAGRSSRKCTRAMTGSCYNSGMRKSGLPGLSLPAADAAGPARPDLNPGIEGLGIERIAAMSCQLRSDRAARFLRMHNSGPLDRDCGFGLGFGAYLGFNASFWFHACLRIGAAAVDAHIKRTRREPRGGPERLWRKHCAGKIKVEELIGTILIRNRKPVPRHHDRGNKGNENTFRA